jgi:hypothetical protein
MRKSRVGGVGGLSPVDCYRWHDGNDVSEYLTVILPPKDEKHQRFHGNDVSERSSTVL